MNATYPPNKYPLEKVTAVAQQPTPTATPRSAELIASIAGMLEGHSFGLRRGEHHEEVAARIVDEVLRRLAAKPDEDGVREILTALSKACPEPRDPTGYLSPFHTEVLAVARRARNALSTTGKPKP